jgi:hypothetical protein
MLFTRCLPGAVFRLPRLYRAPGCHFGNTLTPEERAEAGRSSTSSSGSSSSSSSLTIASVAASVANKSDTSLASMIEQRQQQQQQQKQQQKQQQQQQTIAQEVRVTPKSLFQDLKRYHSELCQMAVRTKAPVQSMPLYGEFVDRLAEPTLLGEPVHKDRHTKQAEFASWRWRAEERCTITVESSPSSPGLCQGDLDDIVAAERADAEAAARAEADERRVQEMYAEEAQEEPEK